MRFISLVNIASEKATEAQKNIKNLSPPPQGKVQEVYALMGRFDVALIFDAPDAKTASDWVTGKVRGVAGVTSTETFLASEI